MKLASVRNLIRTARAGRLTTHGVTDSTTEAEAARLQEAHLTRLQLESAAAGALGRTRVMAAACWQFPIWSQTFVYQELSQLIEKGFALRFLYWQENPRQDLPREFARLWPIRRPLLPHWTVWQRDFRHYAERMPEKIDALVDMLCSASGMPEQQLRADNHFFEAFTFTRMVEAWRPNYLHSYFFYEETLFTFVASQLLDIPRGVSCYADHMLQDYALKVVPLHLKQCSVVVATSARIKQELMRLAPDADPDRILVKPNAIDIRHFPDGGDRDVRPGEPFRLVCVSRIEPKKGLQYLVDAIHLLRERQVAVEVHFIGGVEDNPRTQEYSRTLDARIQELGLQEVVHREGQRTRDQIRERFATAHAFVAPFVETEYGDKDGIPTALLEAMAAGLPVVATDAGSITEVVTHERDGLLAPQRDARTLADHIESLVRDPARRQRLARAARETIRARFDVEVCETRLHERIRSVIASRTP